MRATWVAVAVALWAAPARAEPDGLQPFGIRVDVRGSVATIDVSFKLAVEANVRQQQALWRPHRAVVTGGSVRDASGKRPLKLVRAEEANEAFDALMHAPSRRSRATMVQLFETSSSSDPEVDVIAPKATTLLFDLRFEAPTCMRDERRYVVLPEAWREHVPPALARRVVGEDEELPECGEGMYLHFASPIARGQIAATAARFADSHTQAARVELAAATTLSQVPADLHTVFVIDMSRSMTEEQRTTARALVRSYLSHAPRSSVQVVTFARTASALLAQWSAASTAATIDKSLAASVRKNGSEVQAGLREAGRWLARTKGTRRVVLISDERVAARVEKLSADELAKELPARTLVHVVGVGEGGVLQRDDDARWAALAAKTEGIGAYAGTDENGAVDALELVRPIAIDHTKITSGGWEHIDGGCIDVRLDEGDACTWWGESTEPSDAVTVEGLVWNKRWTKTLALGEPSIVIARQLRFVLNVNSSLAEVALDASQSLSTAWSLMARWGGDGGYGEEPGGGGTGWGTICGGCGYGTIGHGSGTGYAVPEIHPLKLQLYDAVHFCLRDDVALALTVETTLDEIVDVAAKVTMKDGTGVPADAAQIEACVTESVWATNVAFSNSHAHKIHTLSY